MNKPTICATCGSDNVQICLPAWRYINTEEFVDFDEEAEALAYYCDECCNDTVEGDDGKPITGRWG